MRDSLKSQDLGAGWGVSWITYVPLAIIAVVKAAPTYLCLGRSGGRDAISED